MRAIVIAVVLILFVLSLMPVQLIPDQLCGHARALELPDLIITEIMCDRENDRIGYEIRNAGNATAPKDHTTSLQVKFGDSWEQMCLDQVSVDLMPEDSYQGWFGCYTWPECQTIVVKVCADKYNNVEEGDEDNNCLEKECVCELPPPPPPDLVIKDVWRDGSQIWYRIKNIGEGNISYGISWYNTLFIDGEPVANDTVDRFPAPGEELDGWFYYEFQMTRPEHTVMVCADEGQDVDEADEGNNCLEEVWEALPDLIVSDMWGNYTRICFKIKNIGEATADAGSFLDPSGNPHFYPWEVALLIDNNQMMTDSVQAPVGPGGELEEMCFDLLEQCTELLYSPGLHTVKVCVDSGGQIDESNEGNNCEQLFFAPQVDLTVVDMWHGRNWTLVDAESFEAVWPILGWSETGNWARETNHTYDGLCSADFDGNATSASGYLTSPSMYCSDADAIYVDFWWYDLGLDDDDLELEYYNGSSWDNRQDLNQLESENGWHHYTEKLTDRQYFVSDFRIRWWAKGLWNGETGCVDLVTVKKEAGARYDQICYRVKNIGEHTVDPAVGITWYNALFIDDVKYAEDYVTTPLGPDEELIGCFDLIRYPVAREYTVRVCADEGQGIVEADEENNCLEQRAERVPTPTPLPQQACGCSETYSFSARLTSYDGFAVGNVLGSGGFPQIVTVVDQDASGDRGRFRIKNNEGLNLYQFDALFTGHDRVAIGDVWGVDDPSEEIVVARASEDETLVYIYDRTGRELHSFSANFTPHDCLAVGNVWGGGKDEIVIARARDDDKVFVYTGEGDVVISFDIPWNFRGTCYLGRKRDDTNDAMAVGDVIDDELEEIILLSRTGQCVEIYGVDCIPSCTLSLRMRFPVRFTKFDAFATGDILGNEKKEILIAIDEDHAVYIYDAVGGLLKIRYAEVTAVDALAAANIVGVSKDEILIAIDDEDEVYVLSEER